VLRSGRVGIRRRADERRQRRHRRRHRSFRSADGGDRRRGTALQLRVSTARRGYITPPGTYHPEMLARHWFSRKYYNSPMPHSIFFYGGFAIHGSYEISHLGRPASHGCVRLDPGNAAVLFGLVQREGMSTTTIVIH
jgi:lipoprotein-anchoring transpeptidase ErfK/SrfK